MHIACPYCERTLEFSGEPPSFCAYCGHALRRVTPLDSAEQSTREMSVRETSGGAETLALPHTLGAYRLLRAIGSGGMGTVYEAEESCSGRRVAVKLISVVHSSPVTLERFRQEGRLASLISHPRCVFVLAADEVEGQPYIVMELMSGVTLRDEVEQGGPLSPEDAIAKILDVIEGLQEAHRIGVIHRDVKPSNCFVLPDGHVKIGDFGLSKSLASDGSLTQTGTFVGTPLFASPEQIRGDAIDFATDIYSVAATLYYLLSGKAPFQQSSATATMARIVSEEAPPLRPLRPDVSPALERVVLRGLARARENRYRTLADFRCALLALIPGQMSIGGLGMRIGAYLIDAALLSPVWLLASLFLAPVSPLLPSLCVGSLALIYFTLLEGYGGCSLGKRWLRLRVCGLSGPDPPGWKRAGLRALVFLAALGLPQAIFEWWRGSPTFLGGDMMQVLGALLLAVTMRKQNGFRGVHELLSSTRVVQLPWPELPGTWEKRFAAAPPRELIQSADIPELVGTFRILGAYRWDSAETVLLGEDASLGREVLIRLQRVAAAAEDGARRELSRPTRLRWLTCGQLSLAGASWNWSAFVAPRGRPLPELTREPPPLSWSEARPIFTQLAEELTAAIADNTLPSPLRVEQVYVQPDGRVQLLDIPLTAAVKEMSAPDLPAPARALRFLRQVAVLALESRTTEHDKPVPIRAPLPVHAAAMLDRLTGVRQPYEQVEPFLADLAATRQRPTEVSFSMRAAHLGLLSILLLPGLAMMLSASRSYGFATAYLNEYFRPVNEPVQQLTDRLTEDASRAPIIALITINGGIMVWPLIWVLWSWLTRGGWSLPLVGLQLIRRDGRRVRRLQCAWRSLVVWAPVVVLLSLAVGTDYYGPSLAWLHGPLWWLTLGWLVGYVLLALWFPARSLQDYLAGTCLVPK
ncbi:MAG: protein kinase domain-containing protein [Gemmataceae bacterium]